MEKQRTRPSEQGEQVDSSNLSYRTNNSFEGGDKLNVRLLKAKMILYGDENFSECLANVLGITRQTASSKLNGTTPFTQPEISTIARRYQMTGDELREIFVEGESSEGEGSGKASRQE